jgi:pyridoxamine 5'-phosphate oxidase
MKKNEVLENLEKIIEDSKTGVLATTDEEGRPHMRWMMPALLRGRPGAIYTVSGPGTPKIKHLEARPQVEWMLQSRSLDRIITVRGRAQVVDEPSIKREVLEAVGRRLAAFWKYNEDPSQLVVVETIAESICCYQPMKGAYHWVNME